MSNIATIPTQQVVDTRYTQDVVPLMDTSKFEHMQRIARVMSECSLVPKELTKERDAAFSNCFLVVNQATRWGMDPFALAQSTYFVSGKIGFEGKVIAAAINSDPRLDGRLDYSFSGEGDKLTITVSGTFRDTGETKKITGNVGQWKTNFGLWGKDPEQALVYRGTRQWARRWMPDRLLGVYSSDELDEIAARDVPTGQRAQRMKDITPPPAPIEIPDIPDEIPDIPEAQASDEQQEEADKIADVRGFLKMIRDRLKEGYSPADIYESFGEMAERLPEDARGKFDAMLEAG